MTNTSELTHLLGTGTDSQFTNSSVDPQHDFEVGPDITVANGPQIKQYPATPRLILMKPKTYESTVCDIMIMIGVLTASLTYLQPRSGC